MVTVLCEPRPVKDQCGGASVGLGFGVLVLCFLPPKHLSASGEVWS